MTAAKLVQQLRTFQQRLLQLDARNPSIFTGKVAQRKNFDLVTLGPKVAEKAFGLAVAGEGQQRLLDEGGDDIAVMRQREHLHKVFKAATDREEDTGLMDLRLATVWIEGRLNENTFVRAPLLLHAAKLVRARGGKAGWTLELPKDGDLLFNSALIAALRKHTRWSPDDEFWGQVRIEIEGLDRDKRRTPADLLRTLGDLLKSAGLPITDIDDGLVLLAPVDKAKALVGVLDSTALTTLDHDVAPIAETSPIALRGASTGLRVRGYVLVGLFPQSSTALYQDYDELLRRAESGEVDQGIVDNLLEVPADNGAAKSADSPASLDDIPAASVRAPLLCDPSQYAVLREAQTAECTVVRGPPGTGKSQVIANLIVDALGRGERVLVVCQKRAALDVVQARLQATGVTPWAFVVHDATADHREVYARLGAALERSKELPGASLGGALQRLSSQIDDTIAQIRGIVEPLGAETHGRPLSEWYRRAPVGKRLPARLPDGLVKLAWEDVQLLLEQLVHVREDALRFSADGSPVRVRKDWAGYGVAQARELLTAIDAVVDAASGQRGTVVIVEQTTLGALRQALTLYRTMFGRWWRFLSPQWWRTRSVMKRGHTVLGTRAVEEWDPQITTAERLRSALETMGKFFERPWMQQLEKRLVASKDYVGSLHELRGLVREDFERIVALDQRLGKVDVWARDFVKHDASDLYAASGMASDAQDTATWREAVQRNLVLQWIDATEARYPGLRGEPFADYRRLRLRLVDLLGEQAHLTAQSVARDVHAATAVRNLAPALAGSRQRPETQWNKLEHELAKQRRLWPLRKLLREFAWPLRTLAPCWLMSPEVAAEILPLEHGSFDLAIFDEASQLPIERALPVLYRARRVVIAGDEQQMPPSHFWESADDDDEIDDEGEPIEDARTAESLLEQAKKVYGFRYLGWHYRSSHGELIDFSNQAFYDGTLHITPTPMRRSAVAPIRFHRVDGILEKRVNQVEALRCVQLIEQLAREHRAHPKSIGVVAVNIKQQHAIDDALRRAEETNSDFAELMQHLRHPASGLRDDAFVIKNIENVQGDERDIIIFSTGFARAPNGEKVHRRFGAINQSGGDNRLNVAFTRARDQMHVVCSFDPSTVDVEGLKNRGPRILMSYLRYAKAISDGKHKDAEVLLDKLTQATARQVAPRQGALLRFDSSFENKVYQALTSRGMEIDTMVGVGSYRIDMAVVDPRDPTRYCLAIECDGSAYHSGRSVRERDIARQQLLERRGWRFERIWSRDWWRSPEREVERIIACVAGKEEHV